MPHFKWDQVRKRPKRECLTLVYITLGGVIGGGSGRETSQNLQKGDAFVSNPHTDQAHLIDPVVLFLFFL